MADNQTRFKTAITADIHPQTGQHSDNKVVISGIDSQDARALRAVLDEAKTIENIGYMAGLFGQLGRISQNIVGAEIDIVRERMNNAINQLDDRQAVLRDQLESKIMAEVAGEFLNVNAAIEDVKKMQKQNAITENHITEMCERLVTGPMQAHAEMLTQSINEFEAIATGELKANKDCIDLLTQQGKQLSSDIVDIQEMFIKKIIDRIEKLEEKPSDFASEQFSIRLENVEKRQTAILNSIAVQFAEVNNQLQNVLNQIHDSVDYEKTIEDVKEESARKDEWISTLSVRLEALEKRYAADHPYGISKTE